MNKFKIKFSELNIGIIGIVGFFILMFMLIFTSCDHVCEIKDPMFKKHLIRHHHKSKEYNYYHNCPCDCLRYGDYYDKTYKRDSRDYIQKYY